MRETVISKDTVFDECVILSKDVFDPDAVFLEDIVEDDVLPYLSLAVDGLTERGGVRETLELRPDDLAANDAGPVDTSIPDTSLDPEQLEVYGWESSLFRKLRGYLGF